MAWCVITWCDLTHIDLCVIDYSLGDAPTALKHGDEALKLYIASPNLSCKLLTDKMILLTKCSSAIWFLTIQTTWENFDFAWENSFKFIICHLRQEILVKNRTYTALVIFILISKRRSRPCLPCGVFGFDILFIDIKWWPKY